MIAYGEVGVLEEKGNHGRNFRQFDVHVPSSCLSESSSKNSFCPVFLCDRCAQSRFERNAMFIGVVVHCKGDGIYHARKGLVVGGSVQHRQGSVRIDVESL